MKVLTDNSLFCFYDDNFIGVQHDIYSHYTEYTTFGAIIKDKLVGLEHQLVNSSEISNLGIQLNKILNKKNKMKKFYFVKSRFNKTYLHKYIPWHIKNIIKKYTPLKDKHTVHVFKLQNHKKINAYLFFICAGYNPFYITLNVKNLSKNIELEKYPIFRT